VHAGSVLTFGELMELSSAFGWLPLVNPYLDGLWMVIVTGLSWVLSWAAR
jgi:hypothetical protein